MQETPAHLHSVKSSLLVFENEVEMKLLADIWPTSTVSHLAKKPTDFRAFLTRNNRPISFIPEGITAIVHSLTGHATFVQA
jgi:hypothetical protein